MRGGEQGRSSIARFMGNVNGMKINLSVERSDVESCSLTLILVEKHKLAQLGLKMEGTFFYFPRATSHLSTKT